MEKNLRVISINPLSFVVYLVRQNLDIKNNTPRGREVPSGYVIHHKDWNKTNNSVNNLVCITIREHELIHTPPKKGTETEEDIKLIKKLKEMGLIIE